MITKDFQQLIDLNLYPIENIYSSQAIQTSPKDIPNKVGYINVYVITGRDETPIPNAIVRVYVRQGEEIEIPIMYLVTMVNPILLQLPVAYNPQTLIRGPEYYFSTYNLRIDAAGYYSTHILNIRIFDGITTNFDISLIRAAEGDDVSSYKKVINIPPHPRDKVVE